MGYQCCFIIRNGIGHGNSMKQALEQSRNNINETWSFLKDSIEQIFLRKSSLLWLLYIIIAYSFSLFNRTISVDDLARAYYTGEGKAMIAAQRWIFWLLNRFFSTANFTPFLDDFISLLLLVASAVVIASVFFFIRKERDPWKYLVFCIIYTTFPLINEIWEYTGTCLGIYSGILFSSLAVLYYEVNEEKLSYLDYILMGCLLVPSMAGYEATVFSYISLVLIILYLRYVYQNKKNWLSSGIKLALPLFVGLAGRIIIGNILIGIYRISYHSVGDTGIRWLNKGLDECFREVLDANKRLYIDAAEDYFPIFEFLSSLLVYGIVSIVFLLQKRNNVLLCFVIPLSLFFQSVLQGYHLPYRTAQTVQLFVAFTAFVFLNAFSEKKVIARIFLLILLFVGYRQSVHLYEYLDLNNQRSDNEAMLISTIGYRLYSEFDISKPVVFCGEYDLGDTIDRQIKHKMETNVLSLINWSMVAYDNQLMMKSLFSYYGYDINVIEENIEINEFTRIAKELEMRPLEIRDIGDYILVFFG